MKHLIRLMLVAALFCSITPIIYSLTPGGIAKVKEIMKNISNNTLQGSAIWEAIQALNLPKEEDNRPLVKDLNRAAAVALQKQGYNVDMSVPLTASLRNGEMPMVESRSTFQQGKLEQQRMYAQGQSQAGAITVTTPQKKQQTYNDIAQKLQETAKITTPLQNKTSEEVGRIIRNEWTRKNLEFQQMMTTNPDQAREIYPAEYTAQQKINEYTAALKTVEESKQNNAPLYLAPAPGNETLLLPTSTPTAPLLESVEVVDLTKKPEPTQEKVNIVDLTKLAEDDALKMINDLNEVIKALISAYTSAQTNIDVGFFAVDYKKINDRFAQLDPNQKRRLKETVKTPLYLMSEYRNMVGAKRADYLRELTKLEIRKENTSAISEKIDNINKYIEQIEAVYAPVFAKLEQDKVQAADMQKLESFKASIKASPEKEQELMLQQYVCDKLGNRVTTLYLDILKGKYPDRIDYNSFADKFNFGIELLPKNGDAYKNLKQRFEQLTKNCIDLIKLAIIEYRYNHQLPILHLIATGESSDMRNTIERMKNAKQGSDNSLNFIVNAITELQKVFSSAVYDQEKTEIQDLLFINFAYVLAAFDSLRYALFTEGIKNDAPKTWFDWFAAFWQSGRQRQTFDKLSQIIDQFMEAIVNTITIYQSTILALPIMKDYLPLKEYRATGASGGQLAIDKYFTSKRIVGFLKPNGSYKYAYAFGGNAIKFPGNVQVVAQIGSGAEANKLTNMHMKSLAYRNLLDLDRQIVATAYKNVEWQKRMEQQFEFEKLKDIVNMHVEAIKELQTKMQQFKAEEETVDTFKAISNLEQQIANTEEHYMQRRAEQQKTYEAAYADYLATNPDVAQITAQKS